MQRLQNRLLKIINKNKFYSENPLNLEQLYTFNSLLFHYEVLKEKFQKSKSITRYKLIEIPECNKRIICKDSYLVAVRTFNSLPNELKILNKTQRKKKLKQWITSNI